MRRWSVLLLAVVTLAGLTACAAAPVATVVMLPRPGLLTFTHAAGETDVSPAREVAVLIEHGTLESVALTAPDGTAITGVFDDYREVWTNTADLTYGTTYLLSASGVGEDNKPVSQTVSFTTVAVPEGSYFSVAFKTSHKYYGVALAGGTFGVGQPIAAVFNDRVDKAVAEAALRVTTVPAVEGSWSWINDYVAHWRPKEYWPAGTRVTVEAKILGVRLDDPDQDRPLWGKANASATFTIGQSKIAKVDNLTKQMQVFVDGQLVRTIPVSLGRDGTYGPDHFTNPATGYTDYYRTYSGVHVVFDKYRWRLMSGVDAGGPWETNVAYAVQITDSGVYVHAAPWSEWAQGTTNVSHGCVNISLENAAWFFDEFAEGDVVDISNTGRALYDGNGTTDWIVPWDEWVAGSALA